MFYLSNQMKNYKFEQEENKLKRSQYMNVRKVLNKIIYYKWIEISQNQAHMIRGTLIEFP